MIDHGPRTARTISASVLGDVSTSPAAKSTDHAYVESAAKVVDDQSRSGCPRSGTGKAESKRRVDLTVIDNALQFLDIRYAPIPMSRIAALAA